MFQRRPDVFSTIVVTGLALLAAGSSLSLLGQGQAQATGKQLFEKRCGGCHALDRDKEGPRLGGVYGRAAGSVDSFQYSDALRQSKITWNEESLEKWLTDPEQLIPGNDMAFHLEKADERREIIAYLRQNPAR
jgi:cytochrome c